MPSKDERHSGCPTYPMYTLGLGGYILKTRQLREPLVLYPNGSSRCPTISFVPTPCWRDPHSWPTDHSGKSAIKGSCLAASQNWGTAWAQGIAVNTQAEFLSVCICLHFVNSSFEKSVRWSNWIIFSFSAAHFWSVQWRAQTDLQPSALDPAQGAHWEESWVSRFLYAIFLWEEWEYIELRRPHLLGGP